MVDLEDNEDLLGDSLSPIIDTSPPPKRHWFINVRKSIRRFMSNSDASQIPNHHLERSASSGSTFSTRSNTETRIRNELRYFFMNPCQKYRAKKRKPYKLGIQIFKIALVTLQLIIFGRNNEDLVNFMDGTHDVFGVMLLNNRSHMHAKEEVYNGINFIRQQYAQFENISVGNFGFASIDANNECTEDKPVNNDKFYGHPFMMEVDEYPQFAADLDNNVLNLTVDVLKTSRYCIKPWTKTENSSAANNDFIPLANGSSYQIKFPRLKSIRIYVGIRTIRMMSSHNYHQADFYNITAQITFDNSAHSGRILVYVDLKFSLTPSEYSMYNLDTKPLLVLLLLLDIVIILICTTSVLLCIRSLHRAQRLRLSFQKFYLRRHNKTISWSQKMEFFNGWHLLIIISDVLTIGGSIAKIVIEMQMEGVINYDVCSLFLGVGCLCVWVGVLRYVGFFHQYNILVLTLKKSLPHVLRFIVCAGLLYLGFMFCGWVVLGPYHRKFRTPVVTSEALFSLINGDDMYMTFEEMGEKSNLVWGFSQIYLYIFISLFIYIVLSLFIAVIMETYETIKDWQTNNFPPQNEIQRFLVQHADGADDYDYDITGDVYCCCCCYHNNGPDIDDSSDDEELITT